MKSSQPIGATADNLEAQLDAYLSAHNEVFELRLSAEQIQQLCDYLRLLIKWNRTYNLTAIRQPQEMLVKHLLDSLAIARYIRGDTLIDVGTGAGLPGLPLAIVYPHKQVTLLDSNGKKTRFLQQVKLELALSQVAVVHARVDEYTQCTFDAILSRAFSTLADMLNWCQHLLNSTGRFYAMKGVYPAQELADIKTLMASAHCDKAYEVLNSYSLQVPDLNAARHLIEIALASSANKS